jgi:hypothetical protein
MSGLIVLILRALLTLALYGFLGWALWTIWLDLRTAGLRSQTYKVRAISLKIRIKKQPPIYRSFSKAEVILGRDPTCDITLEDKSVSAQHAKFSFHHGQWWIEDLESTNGTKLNLYKLTTPTVITNGDEIKCGYAHLMVNLGDQPHIQQEITTKE